MAKVELKQPIIDEISEIVRDAKGVMLVQYQGITADQDTQMRKTLREAGVTYKIFKNTLMNRAFQGTELESLSKDLNGPNALVVSKEDATVPARTIAPFVKKIDCVNFVSGVIEGKYVAGADLAAVASIPSREVLLSRLLGSMQAPVANFARVIKQIAEKDGEAAPAEV